VDSAGLLLRGLSRVLARRKPDLLVYLGDREEPLIAAAAATYMSVPGVHIAGGDKASPAGGDVDEAARHATTKLSHFHLTMARAHTERILRLGEEPWRVKTVGNPGLDRLRLEPPLSAAELGARVGPAAAGDFIIVIYHAMSSAVAEAEAEMELCLKASLATGLDVFVGAPNSDPGHENILRAVARHRGNPKLHPYNNLPRAEFTGLLRRAKALIGNSSLGLLEASALGLPCVNVGERQKGRLAGVNVQFVDAEPRAVRAALAKALGDARYRARVKRGTSPYGDGRMVERAVELLAALPPKRILLDKRITY
jgi:GDP/UDP-N,N'-diacetylbacillosamine 2-epimerase (hydrolysing)